MPAIIKKRLQYRCWILRNFKKSFFIEHFQWLLLNRETGKLKKNKCKCPKAAIVFKEKHLRWSLFFIKLFQRRCFPVNTAKFLRTTFLKNFCERLVSDGGRLKWQWRATFAYKTGWNGERYNNVLYLFASFWHYYICILSAVVRRCSLKLFLKISQNPQEKSTLLLGSLF